MGFSDLNVSMQMRDTIAKLVENTIDRIRPAYRYGVVQTVDGGTSKATVILTGDTNAVTVSYGRTTPYVGCVVRVNGIGTDRYIEDVMSDGVVTVPQGADMNNYVNPGTYAVNTNARALTILNLPVPPLPATNPNNAVNPKALATQPVMAVTSNATYWTVARGQTVGGPSASPYGTTTVDVVTPTGSPLGGGLIGGVNNIDGLGTTYGARTVSLHITTTTGVGFEYRVQNTGSWIVMPAGWQRISWDVPANTLAILEVRRVGGTAPVAGNVVWLTDYSSVANPTLAGSVRPPSQGIFQVLTNPETQRVVQVFYQVSSVTDTRTFQFQRLRGSGGTWGPWTLNQTPIPVGSQSEQDTLLKQLNASKMSPVAFRRIDQRHPQAFLSTNGDTIYSEAQAYLTAANWLAPAFGTNWVNYPGYLGVSYRRLSSGIVMLRGLARNATGIAAGAVIMTLPPGYRPAYKQMFIIHANPTGTRVDVNPDGTVTLTGAAPGSTMDHCSLSGIAFPCAEVAPNSAWTPLTLVNGFVDYNTVDTTWPPVGYWVDPFGRYWMRGLLSKTGSVVEQQYGSLPAAAAPPAQIHFTTMALGGFSSQHMVGASGVTQLWVKTGTTSFGWFAPPSQPLMPAAAFPSGAWASFALTPNWVNYDATGGAFPTAQVCEAPDGIMHVRGLVRSGTVPSTITGIGASYGTDPSGDQIFPANANNAYARVDINSVVIKANTGASSWYSLDNIFYLREA